MNEKQAISCIIFSKDRSSVLLIKRRDIPVWVLPGGGIDPDETPEQAVLREAYEETGFHTEIRRKIAEYLPVNRMTQLTHFFECSVSAGNAQTGAETQDIRFFPIDNLPKLPPPYAGWIRDAVANHPEMLRKEIEGVNYFMFVKLLILHPILVSRYVLMKMGIHFNAK